MSQARDALSGILKRDRLIIGAALAAIALLAWAYVLWLAAGMARPAMADMPDMDMAGMDVAAMMAPNLAPWTPAHTLFIFAMWAVMMAGMMTPSAAPMILIYAQVGRQAAASGRHFAPAGWFAGGYLLAWTGFAGMATVAQYGLERASLLSPMMASASAVFGGSLLVAAGLYQLSPFKAACLSQCRAPLSFIQKHGGFQPHTLASLRLGLLHGLYCIGCCWALMTLLFVGGVMNLLWIAGLMIVVLAEKLMPAPRLLSLGIGVAMLVAGAAMLAPSL